MSSFSYLFARANLTKCLIFWIVKSEVVKMRRLFWRLAMRVLFEFGGLPAI